MIESCETIGVLGCTGSCAGGMVSCGGTVGGVMVGTSGITTVGVDMIHVVCTVVPVVGRTPILIIVPVFITVPVFSMMIGSDAGIVFLLL